MKQIEVEVKRETAKAALVIGNGQEFWVQKRWLKDGKVSEKVYEGATKRQAEAEEAKADWEAYRNGYHSIAVVRETEKAVASFVNVSLYGDPWGRDVLAWFPKSQVQDGNKVQGWLIDAKLKQVGRDLIGGHNHYSLDVEIAIDGDDSRTLNVRPEAW